MVEDTLKAETERRKENVGKRVTKVRLLKEELSGFSKNKQTARFSTVELHIMCQTSQM